MSACVMVKANLVLVLKDESGNKQPAFYSISWSKQAFAPIRTVQGLDHHLEAQSLSVSAIIENYFC